MGSWNYCSPHYSEPVLPFWSLSWQMDTYCYPDTQVKDQRAILTMISCLPPVGKSIRRFSVFFLRDVSRLQPPLPPAWLPDGPSCKHAYLTSATSCSVYAGFHLSLLESSLHKQVEWSSDNINKIVSWHCSKPFTGFLCYPVLWHKLFQQHPNPNK